MSARLGGHAVVDQLLQEGVDLAFCVPGESYLAVLDGLHDVQDRLRLITCRHEGGAAMMAAAYGKLTGRPGVCLVTRGPGATNASSGVHVASQDGAPMVLLVGQVPTTALGRGAFQEVDYGQMFGGLVKEVVTVRSADRLPEQVARAVTVAVAGRPGPVVVELPEDLLEEQTAAPVVAARPRPQAVPDPAQLAGVAQQLRAAERPLVLVGGSGWTPEAVADLRTWTEREGLPVATCVRQQDLLDNASPSYVGTLGLNTTPGLGERVSGCDVVLLLGADPDPLTAADGGWLSAPSPHQRVLHVHPEPARPQRVYRADVAVTADVAPALAVLAEQAEPRPPSEWAAELRRRYEEELAQDRGEPAAYLRGLREVLPAGTVMSGGAGAYTRWPQRYHQFSVYPSQLGTQSGSMGFGLPAAIAAALVHPDRPAVAWAGDGCFLMTGHELATAVRYELDVTVVVVNNGRLGTIRAHQDARFPGRVSGTDLTNPDFAALAEAYGAPGHLVDGPDSFARALRETRQHPGPALIEIRTG
ncbi:thiamine pyrophosphate-dependent enzyme [Ornithinicoccus halotolerans]|uniref:thiamine pyrophosphate-dependent enzyme n=1 Tax=Ornithinicoccus halotolerans TaxID=1748220 RepID=UPI001295B530|nr:thiamine pyrophosphate-dependent enzyme [Ornithinicoccus halotolerans]